MVPFFLLLSTLPSSLSYLLPLFLFFALQKGDKDRLIKIFSKPVGEKTEEDIKFVLEEFIKVKDEVITLRDKYLEECLDSLGWML